MRSAPIPLNKQADIQAFNARFVLLTSQPMKDGRCPVCLQLSHNRKVKRYSLGDEVVGMDWTGFGQG